MVVSTSSCASWRGLPFSSDSSRASGSRSFSMRLAHAQQQAAALEGVHVAPRRRTAGGLGRLDGAVDILGAAAGRLADDLLGRRVEDREGLDHRSRRSRVPRSTSPGWSISVRSDHAGPPARIDAAAPARSNAGQPGALVGEHSLEERPGPRVRAHEGIGHERLEGHPLVAAERRLDRELLVRLHRLDEAADGHAAARPPAAAPRLRPDPRRDLDAGVARQVGDGAIVAHVGDDDRAAVGDDGLDGLEHVDVVALATLAREDGADLVVVAHGGHELGQPLLRAHVPVGLRLRGRRSAASTASVK